MDASPLIALAMTAVLAVWLWRSWVPSEGSPRVRIAPTDPILQRARERARAELPALHALLEEHRERAQIKLMVAAGAEYAGQWADVLAWDAAGATVLERGPFRERAVPWADVEDWQVELPDGTLRGGFTVVACWRIRERETGRLPSEARRELPRFLDAAAAPRTPAAPG